MFEKATDYSVCTRHYRILKSQLGWLLYREEAEDIDNCFFFYSGVIILLSAVAAAKGFFAVDKYMRMIYYSCRVILLKYLCRHKRDKRFDLNAECLLLWHCYTIVITACFLIILITVICDPFGVSLRKIVDHLLH